MMKKLLLGLCVSAFLAAPVSAQQLDVSELTDYEKSLHRWAWCVVVAITSFMEHDDFGEDFKILDISSLLDSNNFRANDSRRIYNRAEDDIRAALLLGQITITKAEVKKCESDMLAILRNEYVPNFTYLK